MNKHFVIAADARELRAVLGIAGKVAVKLARSLVSVLVADLRAAIEAVPERVLAGFEAGGGRREWC